MKGVSLQECRIRKTSFSTCNLQYASFWKSEIKDTSFLECNMSESDLSYLKTTTLSIRSCDLTRAVLIQTMLASADLCQSTLDGIMLSQGFPELKGLKVSLGQLIQLSDLLGVKLN